MNPRPIFALLAFAVASGGEVALDDAVAFGALVDRGASAVPEVVAALAGPRPDLAAQALGAIGDAGAVAALIPLASSPDGELRATAAWALGRCGHPDAVAALIPLASDAYGPARAAAVIALAQIKAPGGDAALIAALDSDDESTRLAAIDALGALRRVDLLPYLARAIENRFEDLPNPRHVADPQQPETIPTVVWREPSARVRVAAVRALAGLNAIDALPALIGALEAENSFNRAAIVRAIAGMGQAAAAACLGRITPIRYDQAAIDARWPLLIANGTLAVIAGDLGDDRAVPHLLDTLALPHDKLGVDVDLTELYLHTVQLLGRFKVERAGRPLCHLLRAGEAKVEELTIATAAAIRAIGRPAARPLALALYDAKAPSLDQFPMAPVFLRLLREPELRTWHARAGILAYLAVDSPEVRYEAVETLGLYLAEGVLDAAELPALIAMERDPDVDVQRACARWRAAVALKLETGSAP